MGKRPSIAPVPAVLDQVGIDITLDAESSEEETELPPSDEPDGTPELEWVYRFKTCTYFMYILSVSYQFYVQSYSNENTSKHI